MFSIIMPLTQRVRDKKHVCPCQFYVSFVIVQVNVYDARPAVASLLCILRLVFEMKKKTQTTC